MQAIDVLRDDLANAAGMLQRGKRQVTPIGQLRCQLGVAGSAAIPIVPPRLRVRQEVADRRDLAGRPDTVWAAIVGYAGFGADAGSVKTTIRLAAAARSMSCRRPLSSIGSAPESEICQEVHLARGCATRIRVIRMTVQRSRRCSNRQILPLCTYVPCARVSRPQGRMLRAILIATGFDDANQNAASPRRLPVSPHTSADAVRCTSAGELQWSSRNRLWSACNSPLRTQPPGHRLRVADCSGSYLVRSGRRQPASPSTRTRFCPIFPSFLCNPPRSTPFRLTPRESVLERPIQDIHRKVVTPGACAPGVLLSDRCRRYSRLATIGAKHWRGSREEASGFLAPSPDHHDRGRSDRPPYRGRMGLVEPGDRLLRPWRLRS